MRRRPGMIGSGARSEVWRSIIEDGKKAKKTGRAT
jgi:hypothetical protein